MNVYAILLSISLFMITLFLIFTLRRKPKNQLQQIFSVNIILIFELCFFVLMQILFSDRWGIPPIYFDYFSYICACYFPLSLLFTSLIFVNTKITFKKRYLLLFIVPTISLLVLWTNDIHHLFYKVYSINLNETVFGPYFYIYSAYTYFFIVVAIAYLLYYSIKNSGFFSRQSILISIGTIIPVIINALATYGVIASTIYITPITFVIAIFFYYFAVFKFQFLGVAPIALQKVVDRISDSYIILNEENTIIDFNQTFLSVFKLKPTDIRNTNIEELLTDVGENPSTIKSLLLCLDQVKSSGKSFHFEKHFPSVNKYFNVEINDITSKKNFLGTLILLKDITQHVSDMNTIKSNQDLLMEKERLASLGQLIGGIAHNLKTPIMSIAGAAEGLSDLVREYNASIDNPVVTSQDHHDIARDMQEWIEKIKTHSSYMSDVITAVKGQVSTLSEQEINSFTLEELVKRVNILMKHELKNALIDLNVHMDTDPSLQLKGNVNSLVQVINNLISNAIQAYNGETNKSIDMFIHMENNKVKISIQDYGIGMKKEVQNKLFKEMVTTKGKNGTGLGLFMSYSTIRAHFNGTMNFVSELGKGSTFNILLPI